MSVNLTDPNQLWQVLGMLSANDTDTVKNGEKLLKTFLKQPESIAHVMNQMQSQQVSIRHHSALLLKKKVGRHFGKFSATQQNDLKGQLLQILVHESSKPVAIAIAGSIATLAKVIFAKSGEWPELFALLMTLAQDPNESLRSLCYSQLEQLSEHCCEQLKPHTETLANMFVMGCQDAVSAVQIAALTATAQFITRLGNEDEIMILQKVINPMFVVMENCIQNGKDETVNVGLSVVEELAQLEKPIINDHLEMIVQFILRIIQNKENDGALRNIAAQAFMTIIDCRPKLLAKKNLVAPTLSVLMDMIAKDDASAAGTLFSFPSGNNGILEDEKDDDEEEGNTQRLTQQIIDTMAISISSKYFSGPALAMCGQGVVSTDPQMRKAGCAVLGVIAEGCCDSIKEQLPTILPVLLNAVQDEHYYVRECACFALGQFSEYCQPDILHYNQQVLPVIFQALDDARPTVQVNSCYVLEYFCENLQSETLRPYLSPLMTKLAALLASESNTTKEMALTAIAATAVAAEKDFLPYTEVICNILGNLIFVTEPSGFSTRGRALECLGHVAVAIGDVHFARYFSVGMQSCQQALTLNDDSLKENSYVFVANCAKVMGKQFVSYMPTMVPVLIEVVSESEIFVPDDEDEEAVDEDDEDYDGMGNYRVNVEEGFVNAKKAALTALGALAEHTKEDFAPYLQMTYDAIMVDQMGAVYSLHEVIKAEALTVLQFLLQVACVSNGITEAPKKGVVIPLNPSVLNLARAIFEFYVVTLSQDEEKACVAAACEGINGVLKLIGLAALQLMSVENNTSIAESLMQGIHLLLTEKAPCQTSVNLDVGEDEDDEDHDNVVMDGVTDVIGELAKAMGPAFRQYFDQFNKPLLRFTKDARPHSDKSMAIGCYAEVLGELGAEAVKYTDAIMPILQKGLSDKMEGVRRNSAFCVGNLVEATGTTLQQYFLPMLQWLHPLCIRPEGQNSSDVGGADVDNALSAVARMIKAGPSFIPVNQVLPVLLQALPLRGDTSEGPQVYQCLATLVRQNEPTAVAMVPQILNACFEVLSKDSTAIDETKVICSALIKSIATSSHASHLAAVLPQVTDAELRATIDKAINT